LKESNPTPPLESYSKFSHYNPDSELIDVPKGWGKEVWIVNFEKYCGKFLFINKNKRMSWHYHLVKEETFYVLEGECVLSYGQDDDLAASRQKILRPGSKFHVRPGTRHMLEAVADTIVLEISTTHIEEDSIRVIKGD
jgi:mannose-6-phosphate isomerase-like protein (cupin superfamily)